MTTKHINLIKKNHGFVPAPIDPKQWELGGVTLLGTVLSTGHWLEEGHIPDGERQSNQYMESYNCTGEQLTNCYEIIWHKLFSKTRNFSDRWVGVVNGTIPPGSDQNSVAESIRQWGLIDEVDLPFNDTITSVEQFYSPKPPPQDLISKGKAFLAEYTPQHDWVPSTIESFKENLKVSPLGIAVTAWFRDESGLYYFPEGMSPNHATTLVDYKDGQYLVVFDSYPDETGSYIKKLKWDSKFQFKSKRYALGKGTGEVKNALIETIKNFISFFQNLLTKKQEELKKNDNMSKIQIWAKAIQKEEGWKQGSRSFKNQNPGNVKKSAYTVTLGSAVNEVIGKAVATDKDGFLVFDSYESGFKALCQFLEAAAKNLLKPYHDKTLKEFTKIYAQPPNDNYCNNVAKALNVSVETPIKNLL